MPGLNPLVLSIADRPVFETRLECWDLFERAAEQSKNPVRAGHDRIAFQRQPLPGAYAKYVSPRSPYCSMGPCIDLFQTWCGFDPGQGCGVLDLRILEKATARNNGLLITGSGVPFQVSSQGDNIVFVSQWDNFPKHVTIPVGQAATHAYLLMASVTNPMQSGLTNGRVVFRLSGGQKETLELVNPRNLNWCVDHYPNRYGPLCLVEPNVRLGEHLFATVYSVPLVEGRMVKSVSLEALCNESVIGLMGLTLIPSRNQ